MELKEAADGDVITCNLQLRRYLNKAILTVQLFCIALRTPFASGVLLFTSLHD